MTTMTPEQAFLLGGEAIPSAFVKDDPIGTRRGGRITERPELRQQTDFDTNAPLVWDDGSPRMQLVVTVQTDQRASGEDDGRRRFYIKGDLQKVTRDALRKMGAPGLEAGGLFYVTRTGQDAPKRRGLNGAWLHSVEYTAPAAAFVKDEPAAPQQPAAAVTPPPAAAVQTALEVPYPPYLSPEQVAGLQAAGIAPAQAWQMFPAPAA